MKERQNVNDIEMCGQHGGGRGDPGQDMMRIDNGVGQTEIQRKNSTLTPSAPDPEGT